ncbi:hypothetical protein CPK_ORF00288 [Chlamydia pneumoniae LPCoLN]|uniref:Uncharacterized protein n=1 Tax=Chlamydia pneumoniae TaxID=83558 RepID=A0A0F7X383_CHLPN|nr:hypothetical protein CPK_ORF00288 [Chlamydia pneumoniae LPCoLN]CRI43007.1 Uncharacterized protein BN1224_DC9_CC_00080 [Chlamydia pneumoniae]
MNKNALFFSRNFSPYSPFWSRKWFFAKKEKNKKQTKYVAKKMPFFIGYCFLLK